MKNLLISFALLMCTFSLRSQEIAWLNQDQRSGHFIALHIGADFGTVYGISYGYKFAGKIPLVVGTELSTPFGGKIMDDFKAKLTAQTIFNPVDHFGIIFKPSMGVKRNGSAAAMILNISSELNITAGYFRQGWSIAGEAIYEHTHATLIKHRYLRDYYPDIKDDWYRTTGGSFKFGVQGTAWIKNTGVALKAGKVYGRDFAHNPTIPFYADFSLMRRI